MGPYRTNSAPLRARRQELRLELADLDAKMTELSLARDVVERAIDDIDVRLQAGFVRPRIHPRSKLLPIVVAAVTGIAIVLAIGVASTRGMRPQRVGGMKRAYGPWVDPIQEPTAFTGRREGGTGP